MTTPLVIEAYAQGEWDGAAGAVRGLYAYVAQLVTVIMLLGAMFVLLQIVLKLIGGDRESVRKLAWWLFALVFGTVALSAVS